MNVYPCTSPFKDRRQFIVEFHSDEWAAAPVNWQLYRDMISCTSKAENLRALVLVMESLEQIDTEVLRDQVKQQQKALVELETQLEVEEAKVKRLMNVAYSADGTRDAFSFADKGTWAAPAGKPE